MSLMKWLSIYGMLFGGVIAIAIGAAWLFIAWKARRASGGSWRAD